MYFEHGQVRLVVSAHNLRSVFCRFPLELHLDLRGPVDHVVVCQDVTLLVDNHPGTQAVLRHRPHVAEVKEMVLAEGPFLPRSATNLGGGNVYDRGFYRLCNRSECSREMNRIWHSQRRCGVLAYRLRDCAASREKRAD